MEIKGDDFTLTVLAIDVGAGTQDIMVYNDSYESAYKIVMPAPTVIIARRIARCTNDKKHIVLLGETMGGGAVNDAIRSHLQSGLKAYATESSARTVSDNPDDAVRSSIEIITIEEAMALCQKNNVQGLLTRDVDRDALSMTFSMYNLDLNPETVAVAVEDHGVARKGQSDRECRFGHFRKMIPGDIQKFTFDNPPEHYTRMCGVKRTLERDFPKSRHLVMDSKIAAVFGGLYGAGKKTGLVVDAGNGHTTVAAIEDERVIGLFEHHTDLLNPKMIHEYIQKFCSMELDDGTLRGEGGHGAYISKKFQYDEIIATGPRRSIMENTGLPVKYIDPCGDVFMTGTMGLVEAVKRINSKRRISNG